MLAPSHFRGKGGLKMGWHVARIAATTVAFGLASASALAQSVCATNHLGYTETECNKCINMEWSVSKVFPRGVCVVKPGSTPTTTGAWGSPPAPTPTAPSCTLTHWGGATLPLRAGNFSAVGAPVTVCRNGYDLAKSQLKCSNGTPTEAFDAPKTNVTCNHTIGSGSNPQVIISGEPCCLG
jgi:hypothetical protein